MGKAAADMPKDKQLYALYLFYGMNFIATGMTTFALKFYGEIGLSDGQIGMISAAMAVAMPVLKTSLSFCSRVIMP